MPRQFHKSPHIMYAPCNLTCKRQRCPQLSSVEAERFRGHMLLEMARMSLDDNLVMQLHPGSFRNHSPQIMKTLGRDRGFDIPLKIGYVEALKPLLDEVGLDNRFSLILFTLDESALSRELAPLCGVYPCLKIGPPWWFFDRRCRRLETPDRHLWCSREATGVLRCSSC